TIDNNVISGNDDAGVQIAGSSSNQRTNTDITNNNIGLNMLGTSQIRNGASGIDCTYGVSVLIDNNTISENGDHGIEATNCNTVSILANGIGTNLTNNGTNFGNLKDGIHLVDSVAVGILGDN
ncbi:MAG: right-handed parallel beta-helix repeat-containing protein, partial [Methylococcales bacterium]|nr:right-handed parallel beta-helix repeat-containing protein [Methylococcales bacterium]